MSSFKSGALNMLFLVEVEHSKLKCHPEPDPTDPPDAIPRELVMRIAMPYYPYFKVESKVATSMFAISRGVPTARVFFYDSSAKNTLGLEVIFMERCAGLLPEEWSTAVGDEVGKARYGRHPTRGPSTRAPLMGAYVRRDWEPAI